MTSGKRIFGAFTIALALFFLWPGVIGGWSRVGALRAAVAEREQLLQKRQDIIANVQTAYQEYQQRLNQEDGKKFFAFVPVGKDAAEVVSALQAMASEAGVQLGEVRMSEASRAREAEPYRTLSLGIDLKGPYQGLRRFLDRLEQYVRLLNVDTIEVVSDSRDPNALLFSIRADAYFIK